MSKYNTNSTSNTNPTSTSNLFRQSSFKLRVSFQTENFYPCWEDCVNSMDLCQLRLDINSIGGASSSGNDSSSRSVINTYHTLTIPTTHTVSRPFKQRGLNIKDHKNSRGPLDTILIHPIIYIVFHFIMIIITTIRLCFK